MKEADAHRLATLIHSVRKQREAITAFVETVLKPGMRVEWFYRHRGDEKRRTGIVTHVWGWTCQTRTTGRRWNVDVVNLVMVREYLHALQDVEVLDDSNDPD